MATSFRTRFIPTLVGNTLLSFALPWALPVHPHARGEHLNLQDEAGGYFGSSPRSWGTLYNNAPQIMISRFIPTLVGNTPSFDKLLHILAVHPHARGEHVFLSVPCTSANGSSPRSWGTHALVFDAVNELRFIPTLVGNTHRIVQNPTAPPVHPHARGEHDHVAHEVCDHAGSSPRSWGTHNPGNRR